MTLLYDVTYWYAVCDYGIFLLYSQTCYVLLLILVYIEVYFLVLQSSRSSIEAVLQAVLLWFYFAVVYVSVFCISSWVPWFFVVCDDGILWSYYMFVFDCDS